MYRLPEVPYPFDFPDDFITTSEGLLALGGNLLPDTLIRAYAKGIFPWYGPRDPILWWHPDPRMVIFPEKVHVSRSLAKFMRARGFDPAAKTRSPYRLTVNAAFARVMEECAAKRGPGRTGTWIGPAFIAGYTALQRRGYAQSVEVWNEGGTLTAGIYGVTIGRVFFGESMFSHAPNTSKAALVSLCRLMAERGYLLLDCQVASPHMLSLGATGISRAEFLERLREAGTHDLKPGTRLDGPG